MSCASLRTNAAAAITAVVVGVLSGCFEDPVSGGPGVSIPPSDRVTDAAAIALTEEEAERIRDACGDATDLPEPGSPCWDAVEDVEPVNQEPSEAPDCAEEICLVGSLTDAPDVMNIRVEDPRPGSPACQGSRVCDGFEVPAPLGVRVLDADPPATTDQETTDPEWTEPPGTETGTEPTDPVEPTDELTDVPPST